MPPDPDQSISVANGATDIYLRVLLGSTTPPGRLHRAVEGAVERAAASGIEADLLDLGAHRIGFADGRDPADLDDDTAAVLAALGAADGLVLATPVYRGSMTGSLKNLLDLTPVPALQGKVVGLVAMGASDHHYLGAERHLRDVLAFFGAITMPVAVYLNGGDFTDGVPGERAERALDELLVATIEAAAALGGGAVTREPAPLAARAIKPRAAGR
ncbi:MAG TPA: NAD(P)H-dependent oxidoreductase [Solirubrobacterales bacterium]|nr:NAD(P)H-dependent oxidoreductase [Solirubrobacterales bacterium]